MSLVDQLYDAGFHRLARMPASAAIAEAPQLTSTLAGYPHALVVANDVELWPRFVLDYQTSAKLRAQDDPFDAWVEQQIAPLVGERPVFYAHRVYPSPVFPGSSESGQAYVPMQRIAIASKLVTACKAQLVVHPIVGPWISLRALVGLTPADDVTVPTPHGGLRCTGERCETALGRVLATRGATWLDWYDVRASCTSPDPRWRFSDEQALYHYTKDRSVIGTGAKLPQRV
ncbi:MAG TPA: hypothetical protein VGM90_33810 [Kofleriaceae bacterium]|jgi:hypothetical protein